MFLFLFFVFLMIRRPPRSTLDRSSAASDVYKRQTMARDTARFGVWLTNHNYMKFSPVNGKTTLTGYGTAPVMVLVNEGTKTGFSHQTGTGCLLYTSPSPRDRTRSRMPSSAWKKKMKKKKKHNREKHEKKKTKHITHRRINCESYEKYHTVENTLTSDNLSHTKNMWKNETTVVC